MKKSKAIKTALEIIEVCNKNLNGCEGCPYLIKHGKFKDHCAVSPVRSDGCPNRWVLIELIGDEYL